MASYSAETDAIVQVKLVTQMGETFVAGNTISESPGKTYHFTKQHQLIGLRSASVKSTGKIAALGVVLHDT